MGNIDGDPVILDVPPSLGADSDDWLTGAAISKHEPFSPTSVQHLNQTKLARRWNVSPRTLERWRWLKQGPVYLKLGGRVAYRIEDVEAYEAVQSRCRCMVGDPLAGGT